MNRRNQRAFYFALTCGMTCLGAVWVSAAARAQEDAGGAVVGQGDARIERVPEILRMQITVTGQGKTLKEAVANLKARQQEARSKLEKLGASAAETKFTEPTVSTSRNDNQERMRRMFMDRMRSKLGTRGAEKLKIAEPRVVSVNLTAEWPLKFSNAEELLLAAQELQEKIQAADLAGTEKNKEASPEQAELSEELNSFVEQQTSGDDEQKPGTPHFVYVSKISPEEHARLLAEAFQQSKKKAARLAAATGSQLGELRQVREVSGGLDPEEMSGAYRYRNYARLTQQMGGDDTQDRHEAIGAQPGKVEFRVMVTSSFRLK
jgi:uncharacterized protein YggE